MRILFYGGCHAAALKRIFDRYVPAVDAHSLTNFKLIRAGQPVPVELMKTYDWVVYSPIRSKPGYNTGELVDVLKLAGVRVLSYPWLQWNGYHPTAAKVPPPFLSGWWLGGLDRLAAASGTFEAFAEAVFEGEGLAVEAIRDISQTTRFLHRLEEGVDLPISSFVLERFRDERLFLTPDHPALPVYQYLVRLIAQALGVRVDPSFYVTRREVQVGLELPVLPSVGRALGLRFTSGDYWHEMALGPEPLPMVEYLQLHYHRKRIRIATAVHRTRLRLTDECAVAAAAGERALVRDVPERAASPYRAFNILVPLSGRPAFMAVRGEALLYPPHWKFARDVKVRDPDNEGDALAA